MAAINKYLLCIYHVQVKPIFFELHPHIRIPLALFLFVSFYHHGSPALRSQSSSEFPTPICTNVSNKFLSHFFVSSNDWSCFCARRDKASHDFSWHLKLVMGLTSVPRVGSTYTLKVPTQVMVLSRWLACQGSECAAWNCATSSGALNSWKTLGIPWQKRLIPSTPQRYVCVHHHFVHFVLFFVFPLYVSCTLSQRTIGELEPQNYPVSFRTMMSLWHQNHDVT